MSKIGRPRGGRSLKEIGLAKQQAETHIIQLQNELEELKYARGMRAMYTKRGKQTQIGNLREKLRYLAETVQTAHCNHSITVIRYVDKEGKLHQAHYFGLTDQAEINLVIERDCKKYQVQLHDIEAIITGNLIKCK